MNTQNPKYSGPSGGHKGNKRAHGMSPYLPGAPMNPQKFPNTGGPHGPSKK